MRNHPIPGSWLRRAIAPAALIGALVCAPAAVADTILWTDGKGSRTNVKVLSENVKEVVFLPKTQGAKEQKTASTKVRLVIYDDAPDAFREGDQLRGNKKWKDAVKAYEKALRAAGVRPWIKVYANHYLGECYRRLGGVDASLYDTAIQHYEAALSAQGDARMLAEIRYGLAIALRGKKDYAKATDVLNQLSKDVSDHGLDPRWDFTAQLEAARLLEAQDRFGEAGAKYRGLKNRGGAPKDLANLAAMREGLCLVYGRKFGEARTHFMKVIDGAGANEWEVRAGAHLGLGLCYYQSESFQEARYEFLKVNALYGNTEAHAEATFWAAKANLRRGDKEKNVKLAAKLRFRQVLVLHPESRWADKAEEELIKLGESREAIARLRRK